MQIKFGLSIKIIDIQTIMLMMISKDIAVIENNKKLTQDFWHEQFLIYLCVAMKVEILAG